jgi:hypothetical protein
MVKTPAGITFNDYGTINGVDMVNLSDYYFDKGETYQMFKDVSSVLDSTIGEVRSNDGDISALQALIADGVEKIKITNTTSDADASWNGLLFAHSRPPTNNAMFSTTVGCDVTDTKTLQYQPSTGNLKSLGTITATKFVGDGSDLTFDASADVVRKSTGGTFNGPVTVSYGGGVQTTATVDGHAGQEWKSSKGGFIDFKNAVEDYDGRYQFTQEAASMPGGIAHRFLINGANADVTHHLGGNNEILRMTESYSAFKKDLHVGGLISINAATSNSANINEGGQLDLADPNNTSFNAADKWNIDNYVDTGTGSGVYGLGENAKLLRFSRTGEGWAAFNQGGDFSCKGDVIAYGTSDKRLKKKLKPISHPLDKISKIGGYTFEWNDKNSKSRVGSDVGVIAQEIEKVLPDVVHERDDELKTKAVRYEKIIPLLIEGIKELTDKVEALEAQLKK